MVLTHKITVHSPLSLSNESIRGTCSHQLDREYDNTRLVHENNDRTYRSDIKCTMYPPMELLRYMIADNTTAADSAIEYAYQITNSSGALSCSITLLRSMKYSGGFVWDW